MSDATPIDDALTGLSELGACDLMLAKRFAARIEACTEDQDDKAMDLARSYQRMARSYRQTLIVQARLRRELKTEAKADAIDAEKVRGHRLYAHKAAIEAQIRPIIWTAEREAERCEELEGFLDDLIGDAAAGLDFLDLSPDAHAARILKTLDYDLKLKPEPPPEPEEEPAVSPITTPSGGGERSEGGQLATRSGGGKRREAAQQRVADGGSDPEPPPDPPPKPPDPDPKPYLPPWEQLRPGQVMPGGGSGW